MATLATLANHFALPVPKFRWNRNAGSHGKLKVDGTIELSVKSYTPFEDTLIHEFAHYLVAHRMPDAPQHGREFFQALTDSIVVLRGRADDYTWEEENETIIKWRQGSFRKPDGWRRVPVTSQGIGPLA
jgi:predicted SprT family Zn-dependent metalloprotease